MTRYDKRKVAIERAIREEITAYKAIYAKADEEDRDPSEDERLDIESHLKAIETLRIEKEGVEAQIKTLARVDDIGREIGPAMGNVSVVSEPHDRMFEHLEKAVPVGNPYGVSDLGKQFVDSAGYKALVQAYREGGRLPSNFSTGMINLQMKGTLGEGLSGAAASILGGGPFTPVPQVVPGVVDKLFQRLTFTDLVLGGQASTNSIRYVVEGTATSGAAGVGEGSAKPESTLGLTTTDEPIKKIATLLPVSEELLEDGAAVQSYINGRLTLFVQIEEERQLLRGGANTAEVQGMLTSRSVPVYSAGTAAGNKAEQLFKAMNSMRGSALIEPEWVIVGPQDYEQLRLLKDTAGQFFGGGPWTGQYGSGGMVSDGLQINGGVETIWGKPIVVTSALGVQSSTGVGTALVGTRSNAQVWRRGGLSVEASNSHSTYFANNLVAIRAEERVGLALYRSGGFVEARLA